MVSRQRAKSESTPGTAEWVDSELRETKARLHKVESDLAQSIKQTYGLEAEVRKLMEALAVSGSVEAALQAFREEVRQLRGQVGRVEDRQSTITSRVETVINQRQAESSRGQQDLALVTKQMEATSRVIEQFDARVKTLEEIGRRIEEEVAGARLQNAAIDRMMEETNSRTARTHEATLRLDQDFSRFASGIEKLEKSDENLSERMTVFLEQLRRSTERLDKLETLTTFAEETSEAMQKANYDRDQLTQRIAHVEHLIGEIAQHTEEFAQNLGRLDQRSSTQLSELTALAGRLQDLTDQTKAGLKKVYQVILRQRRRRSEALNQEIKELTAGELHAND
jgi:methyl-accepting chemotaxis protein